MPKIAFVLLAIVGATLLGSLSLRPGGPDIYANDYREKLDRFTNCEKELLQTIRGQDLTTGAGIALVKDRIRTVRLALKGIDFWLRYLEPTAYHKINGPLAIEWETEVFEKYEKPYKREGAGLSLAELYLSEKNIVKDSLLHLIQSSLEATRIYLADSITENFNNYHHFFLANRLFLLNLAAIYTTGFECPDRDNIIPELFSMLESVKEIYTSYNRSFTGYPVASQYQRLYDSMIQFVSRQSKKAASFNHFLFIRDYVNPLFALNQQMLRDYKVVSNSFNDYTLNDLCNSIFDKSLYNGQNAKGIYSGIDDPKTLADIRHTGKLLFYDPILSGNNQRSCVSCHKSTQYFTDTTVATSRNFDNRQSLPRNTPSLINVVYNHLLMLDGRHISLQNQAKDVTTNPDEMGGKEADIVKKTLSCNEYKEAFKRFAKLTPGHPSISLDHIVSAITLYYSGFSNYYSPFDKAMNQQLTVTGEPPADRGGSVTGKRGSPITEEAERGFNLFMNKARCATCHFVPQFNGVKPPYISSEFEVIGVPEDTTYKYVNKDSGRYKVNPANETLHAFRTGSIRNASNTKPYMHNGIFKTLEEVIDFYDAGGGVGKGLKIENQTLSADSLKLSASEKKALLAFIGSLTEQIRFESPPDRLPSSRIDLLNHREVGGTY
jgi:cytochrome c peroxidase